MRPEMAVRTFEKYRSRHTQNSTPRPRQERKDFEQDGAS